MPYKRGNVYYVDLHPSGYRGRVGPFSTSTNQKALAQQMEGTVRELAATGRHEFIDALVEGRFKLPDLHAARVANRLQDLINAKDDPPLNMVINQFLELHDDPRYRTALGKLKETAPANARLSWLEDPANLRKHVLRLRHTGVAAATEKREFAAISLLLSEWLGEGARTEIIRQVKLRSVKNSRTRWLTKEEIGNLQEPAGDVWWPVFALAIATGVRRSELLRIRAKDIDFEAQTLVIPAGKSAKARRVVPLSGEPLKMMRKWVADGGFKPEDTLFSMTEEALRYSWESVRAEAELPDVRFHDLRHTYAVHCAKAGMPLGELQQRLGHATIDMTMRYALYQPPQESRHYEEALSAMGIGT